MGIFAAAKPLINPQHPAKIFNISCPVFEWFGRVVVFHGSNRVLFRFRVCRALFYLWLKRSRISLCDLSSKVQSRQPYNLFVLWLLAVGQFGGDATIIC